MYDQILGGSNQRLYNGIVFTHVLIGVAVGLVVGVVVLLLIWLAHVCMGSDFKPFENVVALYGCLVGGGCIGGFIGLMIGMRAASEARSAELKEERERPLGESA